MVWASHDAHTAHVPPPTLTRCGRFLQPRQRRAWEVLAQPRLNQRRCRRPAKIYKPVTYVLQSLANRRPNAALPQLKVGKPLPAERAGLGLPCGTCRLSTRWARCRLDVAGPTAAPGTQHAAC